MSRATADNIRSLALWLGVAGWVALLIGPLSKAWALAPDLGHGWAAPLLIGYLFWERWRERPAARSSLGLGWAWWLGCAGLAVAALPLQLLLEPYPLWPALLWVYTALLVGASLAACGHFAGRAGIRWLGGPLTVLMGALPWPAQLDQNVILPLRVGMAEFAAEACNLLGRPALAMGTTLRLGSGWVGVDEACGGIRSMQASAMVALFFGEWLRLTWGRRAALVGIGIAAAVLGNLLRILFLALQASRGAAAFFAAHDPAGWFALAFSLTFTGLAAWRWAPLRRARALPPAGSHPARSDPGHAGAWLCLAAGLLFLNGAGVRWWYARGEATNARVPHWAARLPLSRADFHPAPLAEASREILRPDYYIAGSWVDGGGRAVSAYYIEWREGSAARFIPFLHNPTVCLPMSGCELVETLGETPVRWSGGEIPFHCYLFRRGGKDLTVAFTVWDTARNRPLEKPPQVLGWADWVRIQWTDVREARRSQPAQLLSVVVAGRDGPARIGSILGPLIAAP
jgi:exosortase